MTNNQAPSPTPPQPGESFSSTNRPSPQYIAQYALEHNISPKEAIRTICAITEPTPTWCRPIIRSAYRIIRKNLPQDEVGTDKSSVALDVKLEDYIAALWDRFQKGDNAAGKLWADEVRHQQQDKALFTKDDAVEARKSIEAALEEHSQQYCDKCKELYIKERKGEIEQLAYDVERYVK